jgi:adenylate kinase family enzyme
MIFGQTQQGSRITPYELAQRIEYRETPWYDYWPATIKDGFWQSLPGAMVREVQLPDDDLTGRVDREAQAAFVAKHKRYPMMKDEYLSVMERSEVAVMSREDWEASPHFRKDIPFDDRMTEARAKFKAEVYDADQYRAGLRQNRPWGVGTVAMGITGSLLGSAPDPTNYIPVFGAAFKAANATRIGLMTTRTGLGALNASVLTAATEPIIASSRRQFGDDMSFADMVMDVALGAVIGGIAGGLHGRLERIPDSIAERHPAHVSAALRTLGEAADAVAHDRPLDIGPALQHAQTTRERLSSTTTLMPAANHFELRAELATGIDAWKKTPEGVFRARVDGSIDLGFVSPSDAARLNVPAGPIRLIPGWDDPANKDGSGLFHVEERHRDQIRKAKGPDGKSLFNSVDEFIADTVANYTDIGPGHSARRLLVTKVLPGESTHEYLAIIELEPRQHMPDDLISDLEAQGLMPRGTFYSVRTAGLRRSGWARDRGSLPREAPGPADPLKYPKDPGERGEPNIGAFVSSGNIRLRDFVRLDIDGSVAADSPKTSQATLVEADAGLGKPRSFTDAGLKEQLADHGIDPEPGAFEALEEAKRRDTASPAPTNLRRASETEPPTVADQRHDAGEVWRPGDPWPDDILKAQKDERAIPATIGIKTPEREQLRAEIADRLYGAGAAAKDRQAVIVLGPPAAGKSTIAAPLAREYQALVVDSDMAKVELPEYAGGIGATAVHDESDLITGAVFKRTVVNGDNIVLPVLGKTLDNIRTRIKLLKRAGYRVHLVLAEIPIEKAVNRAIARFRAEGRFVDPEFVWSVGNRPAETYEALKKEANSYARYSNDVPKGARPRLIEESGQHGKAGTAEEADLRGSGGLDRLSPAEGAAGGGRRAGAAQGQTLADSGRLAAAERDALNAAEATVKRTEAFAQALKALAAWLTRQ